MRVEVNIGTSPHLALAVRNAVCVDCKQSGMTRAEKDVCVTGSGNPHASIAVVSKAPLSDKQTKELVTYLTEAGLDATDVAWLSAIKCRTEWEAPDPSRTDYKACKKYLDAEIAFVRPDWIITFGNEALQSTTGHSGIMKYRGGTFKHTSGAQVFATISPAMVHRQPGLTQGFKADLAFFAAKVSGAEAADESEPKSYVVVDDKPKLLQLRDALMNAAGVSLDVETVGDSEFAPDARIVSLAFTVWTDDPNAPATAWGLPLYHPQSVWRTSWRRVLAMVGKWLRRIKKVIAHNGKYDLRWLRKFGVRIVLTFDTMLAGHILDENRQKGLKPMAQQMLGAEPWAIDTMNLLRTPILDVLWYNTLDTWHTWRLYKLLRLELSKNKKLMRLFTRLTIPASETYVDSEQAGVWVDTEQLATNTAIARANLAAVEEKLMQWVPAEHPHDVNFNRSNFLVWWLYDHLGLPITKRGKRKGDGSPGDPSCAEDVMMNLAEIHEVPGLLLERTKWYRFVHAFFVPYAAQLDSNDRLHTVFKLAGTVTGRTSSGREDDDKITVKRKTRGVNLQQVPRDTFARGIFGAPPGSSFVEADYSQVELRIAAFLAREPAMLALYATGQDIHMAMAMRMTGKPMHAVTKEERKAAKAVNFGFLYGMGIMKFISTAWSNYNLRVTEDESAAFRKAFFGQFPVLLQWHSRQRHMAQKYKRVESPFGRIRHLPDIDSPDQGVRAEAERQAINSPVQGFASDLAILSMVDIDREFRRQGLTARPIGTVHDAINFEIPDHELKIALPIIKDTMEDTEKLVPRFGIHLDVPIVADCAIGVRWGGAKPIPSEAFAQPESLQVWLRENHFANPQAESRSG